MHSGIVWRRAMRAISSLIAGALLATLGCAPRADPRLFGETSKTEGLRYTLEVDSTRVEHGTGLGAVRAVTQLLSEELAAFFRVTPTGPQSDRRSELFAEPPAPGYAVRVVVEAQPDDYCLVAIDVLRIADGKQVPTLLVPYSVHFAVTEVRAALVALRQVNRPPLTTARFDELRKQATALGQRGEDDPMDELHFTHAPRSLERADEPMRYYAPTSAPSSVSPR